MAITNKGTIVKLPISNLPAGYTHAEVVKVVNAEYKAQVTLTVLKATVENADPKITLNNILNNAIIGVTKQITDLVTEDYLATKTVEVHAELLSITNNQQLGMNSFYTNAANAYTVLVNYFVKST